MHIFSYLSSAQLVLCSRVCRRWHVLAWEPQLWSVVSLSGESVPADRALKVTACRPVFTQCSQLLTCRLTNVQGITRTLGRASPPFCHSVERVMLNNCYQLSDRGLQTLSRRCPEMKHVELRGCHLITDGGVLELVTRSVHLKHLDVSGASSHLTFNEHLSNAFSRLLSDIVHRRPNALSTSRQRALLVRPAAPIELAVFPSAAVSRFNRLRPLGRRGLAEDRTVVPPAELPLPATLRPNHRYPPYQIKSNRYH